MAWRPFRKLMIASNLYANLAYLQRAGELKFRDPKSQRHSPFRDSLLGELGLVVAKHLVPVLSTLPRSRIYDPHPPPHRHDKKNQAP